MSVIEKRIGDTTYTYNVIWDKENKKQKWIQIDKKVSNRSKLKKVFSDDDINQIAYAIKISEKNNYVIPKNTLKMICERLNIDL